MVFMVQLFWLKGGINMIKRSGNELTQQSYQALFFFFVSQQKRSGLTDFKVT